jgi:hypothetical protein
MNLEKYSNINKIQTECINMIFCNDLVLYVIVFISKNIINCRLDIVTNYIYFITPALLYVALQFIHFMH